VAAALAANWPLSRTLSFFFNKAQREAVFVPLPWYKRVTNLTFGIGPRYFAGKKYDGLEALLGADGLLPLDVLGQRVAAGTGKPVDFLIVGFDYDRRRASFFRSNLASRASSFGGGPAATLAEAVHASSNAPVNYFDEPALFRTQAYAGRSFWDGGLTGMNNPVLAGVVEALSNGVAPQRIEVLSIGTANVALPLAMREDQVPPLFRKRMKPGLLNDAKTAATTVLDDPPDAATFIAHVALSQPLPNTGDQPPVVGAVIRMNPLVQPLDPSGPAARAPDLLTPEPKPGHNLGIFAKLVDLDMDAVKDEEIELIRILGEAWIAGRVPNQPIRANGRFACEVGHARFPQAKADWLRRAP
jgi:hypothetical protein